MYAFENEQQAIAAALRRSVRYLGIYCAGIVKDTRAVLLTGASGSGKTTLALELAGRGYRMLGDETAIYDRITKRLLPVERPLMVRSGSFALLSDTEMETRCARAGLPIPSGSSKIYRVDARELFGADIISPPAPLGAIVQVERAARTSLTRISTARFLCGNSKCFYLGRGADSVMDVLQLFARVPAYRLSVQAVHEGADALAGLLESAC